MGNLQIYTEKAIELLMGYGPKLLLAIVTLIIGLWLIKMITKGIKKAFEKSQLDVSLHHFLLGLINIFLKLMLIITVASMIGIQMASFVAVMGALGLAVGLALQGSLANFAGGFLILFFKPFKVGDYIKAQGYEGHVKAIHITTTVMQTLNGLTVIIPNGALSNSDLINYTATPIRRVDLTPGIGYGDDLRKAKKVLEKLAADDPRVLTDPPPMAAVAELGESSVNFTFRLWVKNADYWAVFFDMREKVKLTFDQEGISIPFPQRDVHLYNHE